MSYQDYEVRLTFLSSESGSVEYTFPYVFSIADPEPRHKDIIHEGNRADGSIRIPGGKRSQDIIIRGKLFDSDGYEDLTSLITAMRNAITTEPGTLTLKHRPITGGAWTTNWQYTVFRSREIIFPESFRIQDQEYEVTFKVLSY